MLKVRLMGTKNDIKWFGKILQRNPKVEVTEFSEMFPNKGTKNDIKWFGKILQRNPKVEVTEFSEMYPNK